ncbi:MAG: acylneuraminate cytidylyltransferase family protein [Thermoanaerobaculia bacterium]|nr:acylneuraminate cytidylyltransferase family protein [Thermoanaerobaculia bacterium]
MRHTSERVPGKNYRPFAGRPLFEHVLTTLLECDLVTEVVIDTDSSTIADAVTGRPRVRVVDRPEHLRAGEVPMNDVLLHDVDLVDADVYFQTHATNPLLTVETLGAAIATFLEHRSSHDSLFTVTRLQTRLWDERSRPINHDPRVLLRTQDLPPVFEENSCLYVFTEASLRMAQNRIGERPFLFEMSPREALDIDTEWDFQMAELVYRETRRLEGDR